MKRMITCILSICLIVSLTACGGGEKEAKRSMESVVQNLMTEVSKGNFTTLEDSFENVPEKYSDFIEKLSFDKDSDSAIILKFQEIIRHNTEAITCEIDTDKTVYNKDDGTGTVYATIKYTNLKDAGVNAAKELANTAISSIISKVKGEGASDEVTQQIDKLFDGAGTEEEIDVKFDLVQDNGNWKIDNTDSDFVDLISGNTFGSIISIFDTLIK